MITVCFDIDHTIWEITKGADGKYHQVPDYGLIQALRWFHGNGDRVYVWSAGGVDYAQAIVNKLGLDIMVEVIPKGVHTKKGVGTKSIDICFDDEAVRLAKVNVVVNREPLEESLKLT